MGHSKNDFMQERAAQEGKKLETVFTLPDDPLQGIDDLQVRDIYPSKKNAVALAGRIGQLIEEGKADPVEAAIKLKAMICMAEEALEVIRQPVLDAIAREKGGAIKWGCKVEPAEVGTKIDYSKNDDWVALKREEDAVKEKRTQLESILKIIPAGKLIVDEETGETLIGPSRTSTSSFKVTLAK